MPEAAPRRRTAPLSLLVLAFAAYSLAHLFNNTVLALHGPRLFLERLQIQTGGWIEPLLVRSLVVLVAFLAVVVGYGRQPLASLGWRARQLLPGLLVYAGAWTMLQLGLLLAMMRQGNEIQLHPMWTSFGLPAVLGAVLSQLCGHALAEDTAFRGFFLPELRARLARPASLFTLAFLGLAVLGSSLLFGLAHLPTLILVQKDGLRELIEGQAHFLMAGFALGLAFVATRNLFAVVGLHVLLNAPAPLVAVPGFVLHRAVLIVFAGVICLAGVRRLRRLRRRLRERSAARAAGADAQRAA